MDEKGLNEGMTWKEIFQVIKDREKVKVETEVEGKNKVKLFSPCDSRLAPYNELNAITWIDLLFLVLEERSFFSLRKNPDGSLSIFKVKSSKKVLDYFFEKTWERPILRSQHG